MDRRTFLTAAFAGGAAAGLVIPGEEARAQTVQTSARIVIIGAGAAGTSMANRLTRRLDGAQITIIDPKTEHIYQPGLTFVATGLKPPSYVKSETAKWLPGGISWVQERVTAVDPETKIVTTDGGQKLGYDWLVLAPGLVLDHDGIEGFSLDLVGQNGIGALYAGPDYAARTWQAANAFIEDGGVGLFTRPGTELKCAGAPLKHTFLINDIAGRRGQLGKIKMIYAAQNDTLFSVPIISERVRMLFGDRGIDPYYSHVLRAIDPGAKRATFTTPNGETELDYDYIHVVPPQRAPDFVKEAGLAWTDRWTDQGWAEVDMQTLRHLRYPDVFAVGDVAGVPKGKTAASVKWQVPVVEDHIVAAIDGREGTEQYNGYTSCPLITRVGRTLLIEFDYENNLVPSFPGVIAPLEELWISWLMKEVALKPTYNAMLRGRA